MTTVTTVVMAMARMIGRLSPKRRSCEGFGELKRRSRGEASPHAPRTPQCRRCGRCRDSDDARLSVGVISLPTNGALDLLPAGAAGMGDPPVGPPVPIHIGARGCAEVAPRHFPPR